MSDLPSPADSRQPTADSRDPFFKPSRILWAAKLIEVRLRFVIVIVVAFVVNGSFHGRSELLLAALALVVLVCLWSLLVGDTVFASDVIDEARTRDKP